MSIGCLSIIPHAKWWLELTAPAHQQWQNTLFEEKVKKKGNSEGNELLILVIRLQPLSASGRISASTMKSFGFLVFWGIALVQSANALFFCLRNNPCWGGESLCGYQDSGQLD